jgi:hypothetical protein
MVISNIHAVTISPIPVLTYLSYLTCDEQNVTTVLIMVGAARIELSKARSMSEPSGNLWYPYGGDI